MNHNADFAKCDGAVIFRFEFNICKKLLTLVMSYDAFDIVGPRWRPGR